MEEAETNQSNSAHEQRIAVAEAQYTLKRAKFANRPSSSEREYREWGKILIGIGVSALGVTRISSTKTPAATTSPTQHTVALAPRNTPIAFQATPVDIGFGAGGATALISGALCLTTAAGEKRQRLRVERALAENQQPQTER